MKHLLNGVGPFNMQVLNIQKDIYLNIIAQILENPLPEE
jgi:hypothetical protein